MKFSYKKEIVSFSDGFQDQFGGEKEKYMVGKIEVYSFHTRQHG